MSVEEKLAKKEYRQRELVRGGIGERERTHKIPVAKVC
jgi:hypothetical protein